MEQFLQALKETLKDVKDIDFAAIEAKGNAVFKELETQLATATKKNKDLAAEKKALATQIGGVETIQTDYQRLKEDEEDRLAHPDKKIDTEEIKAGIERKYKSEIDKMNLLLTANKKDISERDAYIDSFEIGRELDTYLADGRAVMDAFKPILKKSFSADAHVEIEEDGERQVYIKGVDGQMPVKEFIEAWKTKEEAKVYLTAETSTGSGARGNYGNGLFHKQKNAEDYTLSEQNQMFVNDRAKYDRLYK